MRSMTLRGTLQGRKVSSRAEIGYERATEPPGAFDETTIRLAEQIPYWPQRVSYGELERRTGLSRSVIKMRVSTAGNRFLIFDDQGRLSRLKSDLSNCDL